MASLVLGISITLSLCIWPLAAPAGLIGDKCTSNETCAQTVTNSICLNTTCACSPGHWAQSSARCVRRQIGDECNKSSECSATVVHGTCGPSKVCACETGYKNTSDGACSQNLVGDSCKTNEDCNKVLSGRSKCNKICECVGTFISNANKTRCVERVLGDPCRKDNACSSIRNFVCLRNKCSCNITYKPDGRSRCVPRELGDACDSDAECTHGGAENVRCDGNTCECTEGYTREGKHACRLQYMIYSQCSNDSFCQSLYRNTVCTFPCASNGSCAGNYSGSCECEEGYYNSNNECVTNGIGAGCNSDNDCTVEGTACGTSSVCTCRHTHLLSRDSTKCVVKKIGGLACTSDANCSLSTPHSFCNGSVCACMVGYSPNDQFDQCLPKRLLDSCSLDEECSKLNLNSFCSNESRTCECLPGFYMERQSQGDNSTSSLCVERVIGLHLCDSDVDCLATATNSTCVTCGDDASSDRLCQQLACRNSSTRTIDKRCSGKTCLCMRGFTVNQKKTRCRPMELRDKCFHDDECTVHVPRSLCHEGQCRCMSGYRFNILTECRKYILGDSCRPTSSDCQDAVSNSLCSVDQTINMTTCACNYTHLPSTNKTVCIIKQIEGLACDRNSSCTTPHSFCNSSLCACEVGYSPNDQFDQCLPKRLLDRCSADEECSKLNPNSRCHNESRTCKCLPGFIMEQQYQADNSSYLSCVRRVIGLQACESDKDCFQDIANSACGCDRAYSGRLCDQGVCWSDGRNGSLMSTMEPTTCARQTCLCKHGFISVESGTRCKAIELRDKCQNRTECDVHIIGSECSIVCKCRSGYRAMNKTFCQKLKIGDICWKEFDKVECQNAVHMSECLNSINTSRCTCRSGFYGDFGSSECTRRRLGDNCTTQDDCVNAVNDSLCQTTNGAGKCVCRTGYLPGGVTLSECQKLKLKSFCYNPDDCSTAVANSTCANRSCECLSGFKEVDDGLCALRTIGDANCRTARDCTDAVENSECAQGECRCLSGFSVEGNGTLCVKRQIDSTCEALLDCEDAVDNSYCQNGSCQCTTGYYSSTDGSLCIPKKVGDDCTAHEECSAVIARGRCEDLRCSCTPEHDAHSDGQECVPRPLSIGSECFFTAQCQKFHPNSTCNQTQGNLRTCQCPVHVSRNKTTCIERPTKLGHACSDTTQCADQMVNTDCSYVTSSCHCAAGHIAFLNGTGCHPAPKQLGHYCLDDSDCTRAVNHSTCDVTNNTCLCTYGYYESAPTSCHERDRLGEYKPVQPEPSVNCSNNKCDTWNNSICQKVNDVVAVCRCDYRHARKPADATCIPVQTYLVTLTIFQEAGRYDYIPLKYNESRFNEIAHRVTLLGIQKIFEGSQFSDRYVSSDVVSIDIVRDGQTDFRSSTRSDLKVKVTVLLHLTAFYLNATNPQHLYDTIVHSLNSSKPSGILGDSLLKVWNPYSSVKVADYDECAEKERNDCSKDANCLNTVGSFICICKPYFDDVSKRTNLRPGRNCSKREVKNSQDSDDYQCSSGICDTSVEYTILALTLFLLIVIIFITYEIIQRKQDFSARKLYEKFGTTKIRKLRQASMRRLQASKRKKREEKMQMRELAKKRKEEVKAEENKEKKIRKMSQKESKNKKGNKNAKNIEELNENRDAAEDQPVSIVYPPSLPFVDDETINADICNLPGSVNTSPDERLSRYVPYIEESPV